MLFSFVLWALPLRVLGTFLTKAIQRVEICSQNQYYDTTSLSCKTCTNSSNHKTPNQTAVDVYGNFLDCICETGYIEVEKDCSQVP
jgi:transcription elongation factor Elf1